MDALKQPKLYRQPCDFCRLKKLKCTREIPVCRNCKERKLCCSFKDVLKKRGPPKGFRPSQNSSVDSKDISKTSWLNLGPHDIDPRKNTVQEHQDETETARKLENISYISSIDHSYIFKNSSEHKTKRNSSVKFVTKSRVPCSVKFCNQFPLHERRQSRALRFVTPLIREADKFCKSSTPEEHLTSHTGFDKSPENFKKSNNDSLITYKKKSFEWDSSQHDSCKKAKLHSSSLPNSIHFLLALKKILGSLKPQANPSSTQKEQHESIAQLASKDAFVCRCIDAYFEFAHPFFNVLCKNNFLSRIDQYPRFFVDAVAAYGCNYLKNVPPSASQYFSNRSLAGLKAALLRPDLYTTSAFLILLMQQCEPNSSSRGWSYLSTATSMALNLGLNQSPPRFLPAWVKEWRLRIWSWIFVLNQFFLFSLRIPTFVSRDNSASTRPSNYGLDLAQAGFPQDVARAKGSLLFMRHMNELCHYISLSFNASNSYLQSSARITTGSLKKVFEISREHFKIWNEQMCKDFEKISSIDSDQDLLDVFKVNLLVTYKGSWFEVTKTFTAKTSDEECISFMKSKNLLMTKHIVRDFKTASPLLSKYGTTFRIYTLANAVITLLSACTSDLIPGHARSEETFSAYQEILKVLEEYAEFYPLAQNMFQIAKSISASSLVEA